MLPGSSHHTNPIEHDDMLDIEPFSQNSTDNVDCYGLLPDPVDFSFLNIFETGANELPSKEYSSEALESKMYLPDHIDANELDRYLDPCSIDKDARCNENYDALTNDPNLIYNSQSKEWPKTIVLSQSVGVGLPEHSVTGQSCALSLPCELEKCYRPRYKSDYFAQNGKSRKPRYVADREGRHYISLWVNPQLQGKIRIDWLTLPDSEGKRYSMPYQFQTSNESLDEPDCNPIYHDIKLEKSGIMKIFLVLIKSKQDQLRSCQPLQPFQPWKDAFGYETDNPKAILLNPKQLIQKYQLNQSQLAFTFCRLSSDQRSYIPEWDTTIYSSILTEFASTDNTRERIVKCPNCTHEFPVSVANSEDTEDSDHSNKRRSSLCDKQLALKKQKYSPSASFEQ